MDNVKEDDYYHFFLYMCNIHKMNDFEEVVMMMMMITLVMIRTQIMIIMI